MFNTKHDDTKYNVIKILYQYTVNYDKMGSQTLQLKALNISINIMDQYNDAAVPKKIRA